LQHLLGIQRIHGVGRPGKFQILGACFRQHPAKLGGGLAGIVHDTQKIEGPASALPLGKSGHQVVQQA
jgi:hypothetical protein